MTLTTDDLCLLNHVHMEVQGKKKKEKKNPAILVKQTGSVEA